MVGVGVVVGMVGVNVVVACEVEATLGVFEFVQAHKKMQIPRMRKDFMCHLFEAM
jgi:hypothetical protein